MKDFLSLARSEARACLGSPAFLVLLLAVPVALNVLFGAIFLPARTARALPFAVWDQDGSRDSRQLVRFIRSNPAFDLRYVLADQEEGRKLLSQRKIRGFMIIPAGFSRKIARRETADVVVFEDFTFLLPGRTLMKNLYKVESWYQKDRLEDSFKDRGLMASAGEFLANPATLNFRPLYNPSLEYTSFMLPGVLLAVLFQMMTLLGATSCFMNAAAYRGRSRASFLAVKTAVLFGLFLIPFALTYGAFFPLFGLPQGSAPAMILAFSVFSLASIGMGLAVAALAGDRALGTSLILIVGAVGFTFSGYTWPMFLFPAAWKTIAYVSPLTPFLEETVKIIYGTGFPVQVWKMAAQALAYLGLALAAVNIKRLAGGRT
ncbi:MAG TPA: ABC transporter permease [Candidatus Aminicenantes bacterium]|nr:ABC transporter permease [Candidatus Aminicenantes bacterium]HRY65424.1 ABC transporter permease [Candidatus Aminicenantes bacterium]HRZ72108.1 ABC transporter permease [Candidatus Aminicenantes bacterium]